MQDPRRSPRRVLRHRGLTRPNRNRELVQKTCHSSGATVRKTLGTSDIDGDGDGDRDALALLEWVVPGGVDYTGWKGLYAWLWEDGEVAPAAWPLSWQWTCAEVEDELRFELGEGDQHPVVVVYRPAGTACGDDVTPATRITSWIGIWNGFPVKYSQYGHTDRPDRIGATVACERATTDDVSEVPLEGGVPLLWPEDGSPSVTEGYVGLAAWEVELSRTDSIELHNGYVPVWVEWDDSVGRGWLKWDFNEPA